MISDYEGDLLPSDTFLDQLNDYTIDNGFSFDLMDADNEKKFDLNLSTNNIENKSLVDLRDQQPSSRPLRESKQSTRTTTRPQHHLQPLAPKQTSAQTPNVTQFQSQV